jgi:hypothetical protein
MLKKGLTEGFGIEVEDRNEGESKKKNGWRICPLVSITKNKVTYNGDPREYGR